MPSALPRAFSALLAFSLIASAAGTFAADPAPESLPTRPARVHVVWLDGRALEAAMATGAQILDRFPDAVIVANDASLVLLRNAGFRSEGPIDLPASGVITLLREEDHGHAALDVAELDRAGAQVLWRGRGNWITASESTLPESEALLPHHRKALRSIPLRHRAGLPAPQRSPAPPTTHVTSFAPIIQEMVNQVSGATLIQTIGDFAGKRAVNVGGVPTTFTTRSSQTALCDKAEQLVYERFQALGYTDVQYDQFSFSSTSARNVIATKVGAETPNHVYILGAHLDSTSPQSGTLAPGANDNASGIAGLLIVADILRNYSFKSTIKLIAFTGEEQGLYGSAHYANAAAARGDSIKGVVIFDMIAWRDLNHKIDIEGESAWLPLMNVMNDACAQYTTLATDLVLNSWGSDHVPFQDNNFPAFLAIEDEYPDYPCYHQTCDTTGWNQEVLGADVVRASLATLAHLAGPRTFSFTHTELPGTENTTGPYEVVADLSTMGTLIPDSLLLHWSRGGPEQTEVLTTTGTPGRYHAFIPGQPSPTHVTYWLSARDTEGRLAVHPAGAPAVVNDFFVSGRSTIFLETFETGAPGWTSGGTGNDWQVATPVGLAEDPATAYAGTKIAGTDITGLGTNLGRYEPFCDNWFETPPIDCSAATQIKLSFARKIAIDKSNGGSWDAARILVNNTLIWANPATTALIDPGWTTHEFTIGNIADGSPAVRVRFAMRSNASVQYGGWNLDDVNLTAVSTATTAVADAAAPRGAVLHANVPNPGHPGTTLRFDLPLRSLVDLSVFDVRGRLVRTVTRGEREPGTHSARWDGRGDGGEPSAAGVYFYRLTASGVSQARKMVLVR